MYKGRQLMGNTTGKYRRIGPLVRMPVFVCFVTGSLYFTIGVSIGNTLSPYQPSQSEMSPATMLRAKKSHNMDQNLRTHPTKMLKLLAGLEENQKIYENLTPEEKEKLKKKYKKWQQLPPDQQLDLRKKMKKLESLPPDERQLYQQRFDQWKNLSPDERRRIREKLKKKEKLSPREQEEIRKKFNKP